MRRALSNLLLIVLLGSFSPLHNSVAQDWPQWRGPTFDNHAATGLAVPVNWNESENIVWSTTVPGLSLIHI